MLCDYPDDSSSSLNERVCAEVQKQLVPIQKEMDHIKSNVQSNTNDINAIKNDIVQLNSAITTFQQETNERFEENKIKLNSIITTTETRHNEVISEQTRNHNATMAMLMRMTQNMKSTTTVTSKRPE